jgi:hypothetical protein
MSGVVAVGVIMMTTEAVRAMLKRACNGNQAKWAVERDIAPAYVSMVIQGRQEPGDKILRALGLRRLIGYERIEEAAE